MDQNLLYERLLLLYILENKKRDFSRNQVVVCSYIVVAPELFPSSQVESGQKKIETCIIISNKVVFFSKLT